MPISKSWQTLCTRRPTQWRPPTNQACFVNWRISRAGESSAKISGSLFLPHTSHTNTHTHILTLHVLCYFYRLSLCEKALAEYLDTKRLAFPRFYFISSADLLDILSNGTNPHQVVSQIYAQGMAVNLMLQSVHTDEEKTVLMFSALSTIYFTNSFLKLCSIVSLGL